MKRLERILLRLTVLPGWLVTVIAVPSFALVIYVLVNRLTDSPLTYAGYAASAYALVIVAVNVRRMFVSLRTGFEQHPLVQQIRDSRRGQRFLSEPMYRAEVALYAGLLINLEYAAIKMVSGIVFHSVWFGALAGYYLLLSAIRFALLHHTRRNPAGQNLLSEWKRYRLCGVILLMMNHALSAVVILVVRHSGGVEYPGYLIYIMAMYTFYAVINAVRNVVKFRSHVSPVLSSAKAVSLIAALVLTLSLETAMMSQFGGESETHYRQIMTGCTGFVVCMAVLAMAVYMIVHSTRHIRSLKQGELTR